MRTIRTVKSMQRWTQEQAAQGRRVALVPTMGALHEGHLTLVRAARKRADEVIVSLFVNPTQFGPNEDFDRYPRTFKRDAALCRREGVSVLFAPSVEAMYPLDSSVVVSEGSVSGMLEGASRPGHFQGVLTVVAKLFLATLPQQAYFGEKDAQQLFLIRRMARDLLFPVRVYAVPTVREADGLALSSRNVYLTAVERKQAVVLSLALQRANEAYRSGERSTARLRALIRRLIAAQSLARVDYIALVDEDTFEPVRMQIEGACRVLLAVRFGQTRLIDNHLLGRRW